MAELILSKQQQETIKKQAANVAEWRDEEDLENRHRIGKELQRVLQDSEVLDGKTIDRKRFCELISLQWQIQNLNPMQMPKLLGLYHYKVNFGGYTGTEADLAAERKEKTGEPTYYQGPDLEFVSQALRLIASDSREQHGLGVSQLFEVDGAGQAVTSGFLSLLHPDQYGIINQPTKSPFDNNGYLKVTKEQRRTARTQAKNSFSNASQISRNALSRVFRWETLLQEVKQLCGITDFHELDQFLCTMSTEQDDTKNQSVLEKIVGEISQENVKIRQNAEAKARELVTAKVGQLSEQDFKHLFEYVNTCLGKNKVIYTRFGPAFVGHNVNQMLARKDELNRALAGLWKADEKDVPNMLNQFWDQGFAGAGWIFPTTILYLKDRNKYAVWSKPLEKALYSVIPGLATKFQSAFSYLRYCKGVQRLRKRWEFAPEIHDWVLFKLMQQPKDKVDPIKPEGEFQGFTLDTFQFMKELSQNNTEIWFTANRNRFKKEVDKPLRALVKDVGEQVITQLDPDLETAAKSNKCLSRIRKNIYGKATENAYHEQYWAAFYRKDLKKQNDCQLFLAVWPDSFSHGFYISEGADNIRQQIVQALESHPDLGRQIFEILQNQGFLFAGEATDAEQDPLDITDYESFKELVTNQRLHVFKRLSPQTAVDEGVKLKETVGADFRTLYALVVFATSEQPEIDVPPLLSTDGGGDDPDEITIADLTEKTFLEAEFFEDLDRLLDDKQQLIFCGPPGTSKTFVALEYAEYLAQNGGEVSTVQFHPSYGYEDFIEGLRPVPSENGSLAYKVEDGIFKRLCDKARTNPTQKYVLIVDEINRGNIPRIFGELLFLLERRDKKVDLPYSKKPFSIPQNVVVLGTMNSSDRSIALMDLALRRRFHFRKMEPRGDILKTWLQGLEKPIKIHGLFERLNDQLSKAGIEPDRLIGHAHFMSQNLDDDFLDLVWSGTISPMLEEYFIAEPAKLSEFAIETLLAAVDEVTDDDLEEFADEDADEDVDEMQIENGSPQDSE